MPGKYLIAGPVLLLAVLVVAVCAQGGTLTRGQTFTVTVIGSSRTAYDVWPGGTHDMTGEPGDQPPVVVAGQVDVVQDPPGGPYVIGNHPVSGGGTIRDDVPPDSSTTSATAYYAEVTTDVSGYGVVLFRTSHDTATDREFHIVAENPADPGEQVSIVLGTVTPSPTPVMPLPFPTTMATPFLPPPATPLPVTTVPTTPAATPVPTITPQPTETPAETAPPQGMPLPSAVGAAAAGIGVALAGRRRSA